MRAIAAILLITPLLSGCIDIGDWGDNFNDWLGEQILPIGAREDSDLDGIPDAVEEYRQQNCVIANITCAELGITPPTVGVCDLIMVHFIPSRDVAGYAVRDSSWEALHAEMSSQNIFLQVANLGMRDDINPMAIWEAAPFPHEEAHTVFWHVWVFPIPQDDFRGWFTAGQATLNWIEMKGFTNSADQANTLLHETYHVLLGTLRPENQSHCEGETGHSGHPDSILYVDEDCEYPASGDKNNRLHTDEYLELQEESFENLRLMNQGVPIESDAQ